MKNIFYLKTKSYLLVTIFALSLIASGCAYGPPQRAYILADSSSEKPLKGRARVMNKRLAEAIFVKTNKPTHQTHAEEELPSSTVSEKRRKNKSSSLKH